MRQDLSFALRQLVRQPGLSLAAIGTLGLGLAACLAVFTLVNALLLRPLPYSDPDRLMVIGRGVRGQNGSASHEDVRFLRDHVRSCTPIAAAVAGGGLNVNLDGRARHVNDQLVSHEYFDVLGTPPQWGRTFSRDEDVDPPPPVAILNERFVRREGFDPASLVGETIVLGGISHTIVGIVAAQQTHAADADVFRPLGNDPRGNGQNLDAICRLANGATPGSLDAELAGLTEAARRERLASERTTRAYGATSLHERQFGFTRLPLLTVMAAVGLVLMVAAANTTGLLLVRAAARRREIAVRTAIGASPGRVARTLIVEGVVLAGFAGLVGLAGAPLLVRGLLAVTPASYVQLGDFAFDGAVVFAGLGLCALVGLAVSLPPLMEVLRVNLRDALHDEGRGSTGGRRSLWIRQVLIGAETAVCALLLVGALLLLRTFVNLLNVQPGFDPDGVVTARTPVQGPQYESGERLLQFFEDGVRRLESLPSIEGASVAASLPAERAINLPAYLLDSDDPQRIVTVSWRYVMPNHFDLLRMRYIAGRRLTDADRKGAPPVALVNETLAREEFGGIEQAIGQRIAIRPFSADIREPVREVVGVVSDTVGWSLADAPKAMMFVPLAQVDEGLLRGVHAFFPPRWIVRTNGDPGSALRALETVVRELDPSQPFVELRTYGAMLLDSIAMHRFYLAVLSVFAGIAVALAAVGIYAAYSYMVASRTAEIGVHLALGAPPSRILRSILGRSLALGIVAIVIGLAAAAALARVLDATLHGVTSHDPLTYASVGVTLLLTSALATLVPAIRAARVDPLTAIRQ